MPAHAGSNVAAQGSACELLGLAVLVHGVQDQRLHGHCLCALVLVLVLVLVLLLVLLLLVVVVVVVVIWFAVSGQAQQH